MTSSLCGFHVKPIFLADANGLVASLRGLNADQPPLILVGDRREFVGNLTDQQLSQFLTQEERIRLASFYHLADQERFGIGRIMLRSILGSWLSQHPCSVVVNIGTHGKPFSPYGPFFNISHSGDYITLAIHPFRPVGIDVERLQHHNDWRSMASILWPEILISHIENHPVPKQSDEFLKQWCQYEAATKAVGLGFSAPSIYFEADKPCQLWELKLPESYLGYAAMM